jgi:hypothetical protein
MTSELKVDKITPASGTNTQIGEAGDTTNLSAGTVTLPTSIITGASEKTTLVDADKFLIADSADSNAFKHVQKSNLPSGTLVKISEANVTSNVGSYFFSNVFSSTYDSYFLDLRKARFAVDSGLQLRFLSDSGTSEFSAGYYQFVFYGLDSSGNEERDSGNGDTKFVLGPATDAGSSSDGGITGNMYFYNPFANNSSSVNAVGQFAYRNTSSVFNGINFAGNYSGTTPRYGFVLYGGQQINQLQATLYGIVK